MKDVKGAIDVSRASAYPRAARALAWVALTLAAGAVPVVADESSTGAAAALAAQIEVESTLLAEDLVRYAEVAGARSRALARLVDAYEALDEAMAVTTPEEPVDVEGLLRDVEEAEGERVELLARERALVDRVSERRRRIALLDEQMQSLAGREEERGGPLSGVWDVVLMPAGQHGTLRLEQSGTLVNGTYRLEGGWDGSLQGTLVQRKVYLIRIDSRLGRSMELEGTLSADQQWIRGNWLRFELAGERGGTGEWSAERRRDRAEDPE